MQQEQNPAEKLLSACDFPSQLILLRNSTFLQTRFSNLILITQLLFVAPFGKAILSVALFLTVARVTGIYSDCCFGYVIVA